MKQTDDDLEIRRMLKENLTRYQAPSALRRRVLVSTQTHTRGKLMARLHAWIHSFALQWVTLSVGVFSGVLVTSIGVNLYFSPSRDALAEEVVVSHVRSLMADHLSDVASTDQHTVKPWFSGKLDYAPPVQDFANHGFSLVGGRIDYVDHRAVAALVYRHKEHVVNAFVWPSLQTDSDVRHITLRGFNMIEWSAHGMTYWLVSDLSMDQLDEFAQITRRPMLPAPN